MNTSPTVSKFNNRFIFLHNNLDISRKSFVRQFEIVLQIVLGKEVSCKYYADYVLYNKMCKELEYLSIILFWELITFIHAFIYSKRVTEFLKEDRALLADNGNSVANPIQSVWTKILACWQPASSQGWRWGLEWQTTKKTNGQIQCRLDGGECQGGRHNGRGGAAI